MHKDKETPLIEEDSSNSKSPRNNNGVKPIVLQRPKTQLPSLHNPTAPTTPLPHILAGASTARQATHLQSGGRRETSNAGCPRSSIPSPDNQRGDGPCSRRPGHTDLDGNPEAGTANGQHQHNVDARTEFPDGPDFLESAFLPNLPIPYQLPKSSLLPSDKSRTLKSKDRINAGGTKKGSFRRGALTARGAKTKQLGNGGTLSKLRRTMPRGFCAGETTPKGIHRVNGDNNHSTLPTTTDCLHPEPEKRDGFSPSGCGPEPSKCLQKDLPTGEGEGSSRLHTSSANHDELHHLEYQRS